MSRSLAIVGAALVLLFTRREARADEPPPLPASPEAPALPEPAPAPTPAPDAPAAPPPVEPTVTPPAPPSPPPAAPKKVHASATIEIGGAARRLFDLNVTGFEGAVGLDIGRDGGSVAGIVRGSYGRGTTRYELPVHVIRLEGGASAILAERFRLGGTAGLGYIDIERATSGQLTKLSLALGGVASADLVQSESFALYVAFDGTLDFYPHLQRTWSIGGVLASAALRLGVRF